MSSYFGTADEVEAARAKRRKEIQSWAREDQDQADSLVGVPTSFDQDWDKVDVNEPTIQIAPGEPAQPAEVVLDVKSADVPEIVEIEASKIAKSTKSKPETTSKG